MTVEKSILNTNFYSQKFVRTRIEDFREQLIYQGAMNRKYSDNQTSKKLIEDMIRAKIYSEERGAQGVLEDTTAILNRCNDLLATITSESEIGKRIKSEFGDKIFWCHLLLRSGPIENAYRIVYESQQEQKNNKTPTF